MLRVMVAEMNAKTARSTGSRNRVRRSSDAGKTTHAAGA